MLPKVAVLTCKNCQKTWTKRPYFNHILDFIYSVNFDAFSLEDGMAPSFTQKPLIKPDANGKRLCFECKIKADPEPMLVWYRDNVELADSGEKALIICCPRLDQDLYRPRSKI